MNAAPTDTTTDTDDSPRRVRVRRLLRIASPLLYGALISGGLLAPMVAAGTATDLNTYLVVTAAVTGVLAGTVLAIHRALRLRLGVLTAAAGTCAVTGIALFSVMALTPTCPGTEARCSASEIGAWTLSGVLLSVASFVVMLFLPALRAGRRVLLNLHRGVRGMTRAVARQHDHHTPSAQRSRDEASRRRDRRRQQARSRRRNRDASRR